MNTPPSQPSAFDPIAFQLEELLSCVPTRDLRTPEEIAARRQEAAAAYAALGPRDALEAMHACLGLAAQYAAADTLRMAAAFDPSDPTVRRSERLARSLNRCADQSLRFLRQSQQKPKPAPAVVPLPRPRPALRLVVNNPDATQPVFRKLS